MRTDKKRVKRGAEKMSGDRRGHGKNWQIPFLAQQQFNASLARRIPHDDRDDDDDNDEDTSV